MAPRQVLTATQMRAAEQRLFDAGTSVFALMQIAAGGAAEWIRRIAAGRSVTVLCGPGNNGGDGYVIAHRLRAAGNPVTVIAPGEPRTEAAREARALWGDRVLTSGGKAHGAVFVDCLFGSGLSRPLSGEHALLLRDLLARHDLSVAVDLPSGVDSDTGAMLNDKLPQFDVTLALGAWKRAHWSLPGRASMGTLRLVEIGIGAVEGAAMLVGKPHIAAPQADTHKYKRGFAGIVGGAMPGAALLAAEAAMRGGAGYVKLLAQGDTIPDNPALVVQAGALTESLGDARFDAMLVGPGLGRDAISADRLSQTIKAGRALVLDADALHLLRPDMPAQPQPALATPHDGELDALCRTFCVIGESRRDRAIALARTSGLVILAKGPDTLIAAPDGRLALVPPAPSWLSVAGSGDVLAGIAVSRMACGSDPFDAACEAAWLHGEAARMCGPAFTPLELARAVSAALGGCV